jgi:hypothetical protein
MLNANANANAKMATPYGQRPMPMPMHVDTAPKTVIARTGMTGLNIRGIRGMPTRYPYSQIIIVIYLFSPLLVVHAVGFPVIKLRWQIETVQVMCMFDIPPWNRLGWPTLSRVPWRPPAPSSPICCSGTSPLPWLTHPIRLLTGSEVLRKEKGGGGLMLSIVAIPVDNVK